MGKIVSFLLIVIGAIGTIVLAQSTDVHANSYELEVELEEAEEELNPGMPQVAKVQAAHQPILKGCYEQAVQARAKATRERRKKEPQFPAYRGTGMHSYLRFRYFNSTLNRERDYLFSR